MRLFLNLILVFLAISTCYIEDIYLYLGDMVSGRTALITIRTNHSFNFDQEKALGGKRQMALSQYVPLYTYSSDNIRLAKDQMEVLLQKIAILQPWQQANEKLLAKYLKKELGVEIPLEVATHLLLYNNLKDLLEGIFTIEESILQKKIVRVPEPFMGKKGIEIRYSNPTRTVPHLTNELITLKEARTLLKEKTRQLFWQVDESLLEPALNILLATISTNLKYSQKENDRRIEEIIRRYPSKIVPYKPGDVLIPFRKIIDDEDLSLVKEYTAFKQSMLLKNAPWVIAAIVFMVVLHNLLFSKVFALSWRKEPPYNFHIALLIITILVLKSCLLFTALPVYFVPISFLPLLVVLLNHNKTSAIWTTTTGVILAALISCRTIEILLFFMFGGLFALLASSKLHKRIHILIPSLVAGLINALFVFTFFIQGDFQDLLFGESQKTWLFIFGEIFNATSISSIGWAFTGGFIAGPLAIILLSFLELNWHTASTFKLNRFVDLQHPLMRDLLVRAPGTYQHTMTVAYLAQAAGEAIGASTLLLRTGAYYHDIGKIKKPKFFVENQFDKKNSHEDLTHLESTRLIINHVGNGRKIGRNAGLPDYVLDLIQQHHGTQLVEFFYNKASQTKTRPKPKESDYRYPGPKPQSVEAAILLIVDAVEAASRSIQDPTKEKLEKLIRVITEKRLTDGQFDECNLSTCDLAKINQVLIDSLEATFHSRVAYPWQEKEKEKEQK